MTAKNVLILAGDSYKAVGAIFASRGWNVLYGRENLTQANLVVFCGGTDVDPDVYGAERHPMTQFPDKVRDLRELQDFQYCRRHGIPMVGICRGGQLLNVLNGGEMIQHLGKTVSGDVSLWDRESDPYGDGWYRTVRVDHHQGMVASPSVVADAYLDDIGFDEYPDYVIWYPETKSLCFQPHPEWGHQPTEDYFFELINRI